MSDNLNRKRQTEFQQMLKKTDLKGVALNPGPDLTYFTGLEFHLMERPVVLFLPKTGTPMLVLPELEAAKTSDLPYPLNCYYFNEDPSTWKGVFQEALADASLQSGKLGLIPRRIRMLELSYLQTAGPDLELVTAQDLVSQLRMIKDVDEVNKMQEAARIAECAMAAVLPGIKPGQTEKEVAARLVSRLLLEGSDPQLPFFPAVSFGENSANPHASPSSRTLNEGDLILIDWGAAHQGYYSDITRVYAMGDVNPELEKVAQFVKEANQAAREAVKPGVTASAVDRAARDVITQAGYSEFFIHRTGHGLGSEIHEEPYISQYDKTTLESGMTFTIEPGIYLPGRGGVRIEDDILVTPDGCLSFTRQGRELTQLLQEDHYH
jgi:Xaa-Pro dipeptidase